MNNKTFVTGTGIGIFAGLVCLGISVIIAVSTFRSYERTVSVKGLCETEVKADKAIYPIAFKESGNDINAIYASVNRKNAEIINFLKEFGFSEDEISAGLPQVSDRDMEGYTQRPLRYVVTSVITLYTSDVDNVVKMSAALSELHKKGITLTVDEWAYKPTYLFEGLNAIKPSMIEEATANAREAAQKFADDSGSRLGKIQSATQGQFTISDRDANTPYIKKVRIVTSVIYYLKG